MLVLKSSSSSRYSLACGSDGFWDAIPGLLFLLPMVSLMRQVLGRRAPVMLTEASTYRTCYILGCSKPLIYATSFIPYNNHFTDGKTEVQRGSVTNIGSHSQSVVQLRFKPKPPDFRVYIPTGLQAPAMPGSCAGPAPRNGNHSADNTNRRVQGAGVAQAGSSLCHVWWWSGPPGAHHSVF